MTANKKNKRGIVDANSFISRQPNQEDQCWHRDRSVSPSGADLLVRLDAFTLRVNKLGVSPNKRHRKDYFYFVLRPDDGSVERVDIPAVSVTRSIRSWIAWGSIWPENGSLNSKSYQSHWGKANVRVLQVGQSLIVVEKTDVIRYLQPVMKRICSVFRYSEKIAFFFFFYCWWMMLPMSGCLPLSWRQSKTKQNHPPSFYNCLSTGDGHNSVIQWLNSSVDLPCRPTTSIGKRHFI